MENAEVVVGSSRQREAVASALGQRALELSYPSPLEALWPLLAQHRQRRLALLASGDPLFYGIGATLLGRLPLKCLVFHPHISSVQAAFARLKKPWHAAQVISLHGRPLSTLRRHLGGEGLYAILTDGQSHPQALARELAAVGHGDAQLWVAENLGMADERCRQFRAAALAALPTTSTTQGPREGALGFSPLHVVVIETYRRGQLREFPGFEDDAFRSADDAPGEGQFTKREVRLVALAQLAPTAHSTGWDIGAGSGSVALEWARWVACRVFAVERDPARLAGIEALAEGFGVADRLIPVSGMAPGVLADLPDPDGVFVGGGGPDLAKILALAWQRLRPGGRLVATAVTEESRAVLGAFGGDRLTEIAIAHGQPLGHGQVLRPQLPVLLMTRHKEST